MQASKQIDLAPRQSPLVEELALSFAMARGMDEVMAVVRENARRLIGADGVTFVLREGGKCFYADEDAISPLWKGQRFPLEHCISGWSMLHRETVVIDDIYADDRIPHAAYRPTFVRSLVMVPVRQEDPIGAIGAYWAETRQPTDDDIRLIQWVANCAAVAMTNVALFNSLAAAKEEAMRAKEAIIIALASLAETRDTDTGNHVRRTQQLMRIIAEAALQRGLYAPELDASFVELLYKSAPLHDIGKVGIPDKVLLKAGKLDAEEFEIMKRHAELGRIAIANAERHLGTHSSFFRVAQQIAHTHHEKWDGSGYPRGLKGEDIPISGRLMAIVDVYDALISRRIYKPAIPHAQAIEIIAGEAGRHFDPRLVEVFLEVAPAFQAVARSLADEERVNQPPAAAAS
jgi:putative two-component system response regulator